MVQLRSDVLYIRDSEPALMQNGEQQANKDEPKVPL